MNTPQSPRQKIRPKSVAEVETALESAVERQTAVERQRNRTRALAELPLLAVIALAVAFVLKTFVAQAYYIPSGSMEPQLQVGDRVIVSKLAYDLHSPRRGDIVVFPSPEDHSPGDQGTLPGKLFRGVLEAIGARQPSRTILIKRVIGLPGETVQGHDGHVYIDGRQLIEPYLPANVATEDFGPVTLPPGELWLMGDNRLNSEDSTRFGPVHESDIIGRAIAKIWPPGGQEFL
ncbi:MAG TPA: signal peptidase I [Acidimicrobiales bacterium]|jgi:signal peptidase I